MYRIEAAAGQTIRIDLDLINGSTLDPFFRIFDLEGNQIATIDDGADPPGNEGEFTFETAGSYFIGVSDYSNGAYDILTGVESGSGSTFGEYELTILTSTPLGTIDSSTPTLNLQDFVEAGKSQLYRFSLNESRDIGINLSGIDNDAFLDLYLYDLQRNLIDVSLSGGSNPILWIAQSLAAGDYYIEVVSIAGASDFLLTVSGATLNDLILNATNLGTISTFSSTFAGATVNTSNDIQDYYRFLFDGPSGAVRVILSDLQLDANVEVLDSAGRIIRAGVGTEEIVVNGLTNGETYYVRVAGLSGPTNYNLTVQGLSGPTDITLANNSVAENLPSGTTVGSFSTTDADAGDVFTYQLINYPGFPDNAAFMISGKQLRTNTSFNFEAQSSFSIRVRTTDQSGLFFEKTFTINITNVNEFPQNISLSNVTIAENRPVNTTVGTFSTTDPDSGNTFTYSLVGGEGSTDNARFTIVGNVLRTNAVFNFEAKSSYSIRVRTTDQNGLIFNKTFTIRILNVVE